MNYKTASMNNASSKMTLRKWRKLFRSPKLFFQDAQLKRKMDITAPMSAVKSNEGKHSFHIISVASSSEINGNEQDIARRLSNLDGCRKIFLSVVDGEKKRSSISGTDLGSQKVTPAGSMTELVEKYKCDYVVFVRSVDILSPNFLSDLIRKLADISEAAPGIIIPMCIASMKNGGYKEVQRGAGSKTSCDSVAVTSLDGLIVSLFGVCISRSLLSDELPDQGEWEALKLNGEGLITKLVSASVKKNKDIWFYKEITYSYNHRYPLQTIPILEGGDIRPASRDLLNVLGQFDSMLSAGARYQTEIVQTRFIRLIEPYLKKAITHPSAYRRLANRDGVRLLRGLIRQLQSVDARVVFSLRPRLHEIIYSFIMYLKGVQYVSNLRILQLDEMRGEVLVNYFSNYSTEIEILGCETTYQKHVAHVMPGGAIINQYRTWLKFHDDDSILRVAHARREMQIIRFNKKIRAAISYRDILDDFYENLPRFSVSRRFERAWIFMDRDDQADDNAEHLYRYVLTNYPHIKAYFVVRRESHDWDRLAAEGFRLLEFGSKRHEDALESCDVMISSHAAQFALDYFRDKRMPTKKFVFLQHGITQNDLGPLFVAEWKKFSLMICAARAEYNSIIGRGTSYKFSERVVKLTGFPRHDALLKGKRKASKEILIMPTWRPYLLGDVVDGTKRELNSNFFSSLYAKSWLDVLNDQELLEGLGYFGYQLVFFPHVNMQPYLDSMKIDPRVVTLSHKNVSIQALFQESAAMVTDYSSVAFEMAYIGRPVAYYQFDKHRFYEEGIYNPGYFDYERDGLGPVFYDLSMLRAHILSLAAQDCKFEGIYKDRSDVFFEYRDGGCCERVVREILGLFALETRTLPRPYRSIDASLWASQTQRASTS